jgi:hypothetical protein
LLLCLSCSQYLFFHLSKQWSSPGKPSLNWISTVKPNYARHHIHIHHCLCFIPLLDSVVFRMSVLPPLLLHTAFYIGKVAVFSTCLLTDLTWIILFPPRHSIQPIFVSEVNYQKQQLNWQWTVAVWPLCLIERKFRVIYEV